MYNLEFEWDFAKEQENIRKHKVSFADALECFFDPLGFRLIDQSHSSQEARYYWVGKAEDGRVLTTYFTMRGHFIRIIGCAQWRKFRKLYYEVTKNE